MQWPGLTRPSIVPIERWMAGSAAGHDEIRDYGSMTKWVYAFGDGKAEGKAEMRNLLGGKGSNLAEMSNLGLPVPPGLTITTEVCTYYYANKENYPPDLKDQVGAALREVGYQAKGNFGDPDKPLLLSVRSGARVSMPGMMDTVLNLGLNAATAEGLAQPPRQHLSPAEQYPGGLGHGGHGTGHGVRQSRRDLGHRGGFHPRSGDR